MDNSKKIKIKAKENASSEEEETVNEGIVENQVETADINGVNIEEAVPVTNVDVDEAPPVLTEEKENKVEENKEVVEKIEEKPEEIVEDKSKAKKRKVGGNKSDEVLSGDSSNESKDPQPPVSTPNKPDDSAITTDPTSDLNLPPKQTLGKGKRARIPNKRYSDIILSPSPRATHKSNPIENGEKHETGETAETTLKSRSNTTSPTAKRVKLSTQALQEIVNNPCYRKPFDYGWKRELVFREKSYDCIYYTPNGKKLRTVKEIEDHLTDDLTVENFTFVKESLGLDDPEKEIVRGTKGGYKKLAARNAAALSPKILSPVRGGVVLKGAGLKVGSPKLPAAEQASPKAKPNTRNLGNIKVKLPNKKGEKKKADDDAMDVDTGPPPAKRQSGRKPAKSNLEMESKPCQPCSIRCQGVSGLVPTLHCQLCLCLYHYECVGLSPLVQIDGYACKNCQLEHGQNIAQTPDMTLPRLTSINTLKQITAQSAGLPKLQRIRSNESPPLPLPPSSSQPPQDFNRDDEEEEEELDSSEHQQHSRLSNINPNDNSKNINGNSSSSNSYTNQNSKKSGEGNKSLVGSVTSWLPHSSTIQVDNMQRNKENEPLEAPRPQYVEYLGGRKFLIIPKHNVVSISPTINKQWLQQQQLQTSRNLIENCTTNNNNNQQSEFVDETNGNNHHDGMVTGEEEGANDEPKHSKDDDPEAAQNVEVTATTPQTIKGKKRASAAKNNNLTTATVEKIDEPKFMDNYLQHISYGYNTLLYVFQYLKVQDLLRAGCVCTMWRDIASHPSLWKTVRMKNSQVHSFEGLAKSLQKHGTIHLDLRKMLLPANGGDDIWPEFSKSIEKVRTLRRIELCRCPSIVVEQLAVTNPELEVINAVTIKCEIINLELVSKLTKLKELRLKSTTGLTISSDITALKELTGLKHLSLTSIKDLNKLSLDIIAGLTNLESLDLGECTDLPEDFGPKILIKLVKLEKLRLEKGQGNCHTFEILDAVRQMPRLEQLELVNFDIKTGFDVSLGLCSNIKKLLIIPTYISQSATTNHMVLGGVLRLQSTLSHFVWGVTLELLRVTELFVDQCEDIEKKDKKDKKAPGSGDSIPVLKPVPSIIDKNDEILPAHDPPQVEILPLPNLQKLLLQSLPTTRVKILKIPFHATWRQSITDSVN